MSKLAQAIDATLTGEVRAPQLKYTTVQLQSTDITQQPYLMRQYRLSTKLQADGWVGEGEIVNGESAIVAMKRSLKRSMIEEVFGEFRPMLLNLHAALYDTDMTRARDIVAQIEQQMFYDGI
jgi:hypothetical protein